MNEKLEKKILEKLQNRVFEVDKELKQKEEFKQMKDATIASLAELTSLSNKEIDEIATQIHNEYREKEQKKHLQIFIIIAAVTLLGLILLWQYTQIGGFLKLMIASGAITGFIIYYQRHFYPKQIIIDNFDNQNFKWNEGNYANQHRELQHGKYIFETKKKAWCYWDKVPVNLPQNCTITVKARWIRGVYKNDYGLVLLDQNNDYACFSLCGNGDSSYLINKNSKFIVNKPWKLNTANRTATNEIKLHLQGTNFNFYSNNRLAFKGSIADLTKITDLGLRVCDQQKVEFYSIKVVNLDNQQIIFNEDFTNPHQSWDEKKEFQWHKEINPEGYLFSTKVEDYCYWTYRDITVKGNCDIMLTSQWIEGGLDNYGLMVYYNSKDYIGFELQNNGNTRYLINAGGKYKYVGDYIETPHESTGKNTIHQVLKIRNRKLSYYVNETFINQIKFPSNSINSVAVRVCGYQKVLFKKLIIEEK